MPRHETLATRQQHVSNTSATRYQHASNTFENVCLVKVSAGSHTRLCLNESATGQKWRTFKPLLPRTPKKKNLLFRAAGAKNIGFLNKGTVETTFGNSTRLLRMVPATTKKEENLHTLPRPLRMVPACPLMKLDDDA